MTIIGSHGDSKTYFETKVPPRHFVSLSSGRIVHPETYGAEGGEACRYETDAEYDARVAAELRGE